jgi:hypothetical protein
MRLAGGRFKNSAFVHCCRWRAGPAAVLKLDSPDRRAGFGRLQVQVHPYSVEEHVTFVDSLLAPGTSLTNADFCWGLWVTERDFRANRCAYFDLRLIRLRTAVEQAPGRDGFQCCWTNAQLKSHA